MGSWAKPPSETAPGTEIQNLWNNARPPSSDTSAQANELPSLPAKNPPKLVVSSPLVTFSRFAVGNTSKHARIMSDPAGGRATTGEIESRFVTSSGGVEQTEEK